MNRPSYIIEFVQIGHSVKVSAIDPITLAEVSVIGSPRASQESLKRLAIKKLELKLNKQERDAGSASPRQPEPPKDDNLY